QILMNLVTNAAHAIGARPGIVEVVVDNVVAGDELMSMARELRAGRHARISISDDGCGMDKATLARVFDPFFTTKPSGQGTGLGLSVVHGIVKNHQGAITVYSEPGKGSTFRVYLPAATIREAEPAPLPEGVGPGHRERILYIDDDEAVVLLTTNLLERLGYQV